MECCIYMQDVLLLYIPDDERKGIDQPARMLLASSKVGLPVPRPNMRQ